MLFRNAYGEDTPVEKSREMIITIVRVGVTSRMERGMS